MRSHLGLVMDREDFATANDHFHPQVYSDLRIAFAVSENLDFLRGLTMVGELTFNRPPVLAQLYYQVRNLHASRAATCPKYGIGIIKNEG
jgi:hypothetical protein